MDNISQTGQSGVCDFNLKGAALPLVIEPSVLTHSLITAYFVLQWRSGCAHVVTSKN